MPCSHIKEVCPRCVSIPLRKNTLVTYVLWMGIITKQTDEVVWNMYGSHIVIKIITIIIITIKQEHIQAHDAHVLYSHFEF